MHSINTITKSVNPRFKRTTGKLRLLGLCGFVCWLLLLSSTLIVLAQQGPTAPTPAQSASAEEVSFPSGTLTLHGFVFKPSGTGPFSAVLWNHGSERLPGRLQQLADFFTGKGYVFFVPHRRGQGRSSDAGPYI